MPGMASWYSINPAGRLAFAVPPGVEADPLASPDTPADAMRQQHAAPRLLQAPKRHEPFRRAAQQAAWYTLDRQGVLAYTEACAAPTTRVKTSTAPRALRSRAKAQNLASRVKLACADPLRDAFAAVQQEMRRTRGKTGEEQRQRVRAVMASMTLEQQQQAARERAQVSRLSAQRVSAINQYTEYCMKMGKPSAVFPIGCDAVAGYLTWKVFKAGKQRASSHALPSHLSNLKVAAEELGQWSVESRDAATIAAVIKQLQETCPSMPQRSESIPLAWLVSACARLRRAGTLQAMQTRAVLAVSAGALTRGKEVGGEEGMRWQDLVADERGLAFKAHFCKMGKQSLAARVRVCPHMPRDLEEICPARCLTDFKEAWSAAGGPTAPDQLVWCRITCGKPSLLPLPCAEAQAMIEAEFKVEGAASKVGAHWGRHAGRHLLVHELAMGATGADLAGDWQPSTRGKSSASKDSKSTGEKHYAHHSVDEAWQEVLPFMTPALKSRCCKRKL